jgi:GNAT superfamily N-acetyltransferase
LIRRAVPGDLDVVLELSKEFCVLDGHVFDAGRVKPALVPLLASDQHGVVHLVEEEGWALGYAVVTWGYSLESGGRDALIDEIYIRDRGSGVGTSLLGAILEDLKARGVLRLTLETENANEAARRFYARHGFVAEDSVWMSLDLS